MESEINNVTNAKLVQICIGMHQVVFNFLDGLIISVECDIVLKIGNEEFIWKADTNNHVPFNLVLDKSILSYSIDTNDLTIQFSNDITMQFIFFKNGFESLQILNGSGTILVK